MVGRPRKSLIVQFRGDGTGIVALWKNAKKDKEAEKVTNGIGGRRFSVLIDCRRYICCLLSPIVLSRRVSGNECSLTPLSLAG